MTATASSSENLFLSLLGSEYVRAAGAADAVGGLQPKLVVEPGTERELAEILRLSNEGGVAKPAAAFKNCRKRSRNMASGWRLIHSGRKRPPSAACSPPTTAAHYDCVLALSAI